MTYRIITSLIYIGIGENIEFTEYFKQQFDLVESEKSKVRSRLKILICGSYYPVTEFERLIKIRDELRKRGWKKACLVKDFKQIKRKKRDLPTLRERTYHAMHNSDVIIFLFTKGGQSDGRGMEIEHIFSTPFLLWKSIMIFEEESDGRRYGSELILDELQNLEEHVKVAPVSVGDEEALLETIESQLVNFLSEYARVVPKDTRI